MEYLELCASGQASTPVDCAERALALTAICEHLVCFWPRLEPLDGEIVLYRTESSEHLLCGLLARFGTLWIVPGVEIATHTRRELETSCAQTFHSDLQPLWGRNSLFLL